MFALFSSVCGQRKRGGVRGREGGLLLKIKGETIRGGRGWRVGAGRVSAARLRGGGGGGQVLFRGPKVTHESDEGVHE